MPNKTEILAFSELLRQRYFSEWMFDTDYLPYLYSKTHAVARRHPYVQYKLIEKLTDEKYCDTSLVYIVKKLYSDSDKYEVLYEELVNIADDVKMYSL